MKINRFVLEIGVVLTLVAVAIFMFPENRAAVTTVFQSKNSFGGRPKNDWLTELASPKLGVRFWAHATLVYQEDGSGAVPMLIDGLKNESAQVRAECADILGSYGTHGVAAIPPLIDALTDKDPAVRIKATDSLQKLVPDSKVAIPNLTKLLKDPDINVRVHAAGCLGGFRSDATLAWDDLMKLHQQEKDSDALGQIAKVMYSIDKAAAKKAGVPQPIVIRPKRAPGAG
jgi:HEAT repeat protein